MSDPDPTRKQKGRRPRGDGSVFFARSKGCWVWKAVTGAGPDGGVRYTQGWARTQADAVKKKQAAERAGRAPDAARETVGDHLTHWLDDVAKPNTRYATWQRYEQVVRIHLRPRIGGVPLRALTVAQVTKLWADLSRAKVKAGTVKKCSEVFATALEVAVSEGKIATAPTGGAARPRVIRGEVEVFSDDEVRKLLAAAAGDRLEALFALAAGTGAREGELLALEPADFDLPAGTVRIVKMLDYRDGQFAIQPTKSKSGVRAIDLPAFALDPVRRHLVGRGSGPCFTTAEGTYIARTNFIRRDWRGLTTRAGVPYRKFHTLRHTHASRLLADGVDPAEVARRIGDRIETVMRVYAHWVPTLTRNTAARVDAIYAVPVEEKPHGGGKVAGRSKGAGKKKG
ncbi:tyrosine-type recombinase/integrase [Gemmata sp.]|uniref:tyrosine-type recombinase/integrase n=1 Tax=Gemmata sp. TaxID=1914242 RepID=UPI003F701730